MYNNAPQAGLASLVNSPYRDMDVMRVQMTPREVAGLQQIALSYGANEQDLYDPVTGEPRFLSLKNILPMIAGAVLGPAGFGLSPFAAAATVGIGYGLVEGDLKKGLMAGLGAYSGGKIGEGLKAAGEATAPAPEAPAIETPAAISRASPDAASRFLSSSNQAMRNEPIVIQPPVGAATAQAGTTVRPPGTFGENFSSATRGLQNVFGTGDAGTQSRSAFMSVFDNPLSKYATVYGGLAALTPEQKPLDLSGVNETIVYIPGGPNPMYGTGADQPPQLPGKYYKRTSKGMVPYNPYQLAPGVRGAATGGLMQAPDQNMNQQRMIPHQNVPYPYPNQNYPLSTVVQANYQSNVPQPREVVSGYEPKIDPFTGEEKFAEGGEVDGLMPEENIFALRQRMSPALSPEREQILPAQNPFAAQTAAPVNRQIADEAAARNYQQQRFSDTLSIMNMNPGMSYNKALEYINKVQPDQPQMIDKSANFNWGADLAYDPSIYAKQFNWQKYIAENPDLAAAGIDTPFEAATHYSNYGKQEGRGGVEFLNPNYGQEPSIDADMRAELRGIRMAELQGQDQPAAGLPAVATPSATMPPPRQADILSPSVTATTVTPVPEQPPTPTVGLPAAMPRRPRLFGMDQRNEVDTMPLPTDPNVLANRAYVAELNRRAMNPTFTPYGSFTGASTGTGGLGGTNVPWTGLSPYGTPIQSGVGGGEGTTGGTTGDILTNVAAMYGVQKGLGALVGSQPVQDFLVRTGLKRAATTAAGAGTSTAAGAGTSTAAGATTPAAAGTQSAAGTGSNVLSEAQQKFSNWLGQKGFDVSMPSGPIGYATAALGAYNTAKAIEQGKEGKAALNAAITAAQFGGPMVAAAAAALAAIGASVVNTKEFGDVALRNYWGAVDKGRTLGSAPPEELAQGFINFYRTNKNNFAGQERYGRTGNEDFVYDLTQVVNKAVETGLVPKNASAGEIYQKAVQPWLNSMGSGPQNEDARRIQDFMMTDLIHNFMQGKPISNAQVKGDKKYKIVSEKPVFIGASPVQPQPVQSPAGGSQNVFNPYNPYADQPVAANREIMEEPMYMGNMSGLTFAGGGAIGEDYNFGFAQGGMPEYQAGGTLLNGPGDGMSDDIPAVIRGKGVQRAALADGEFVVPADVVSHLGNGSTNAGAKKLHQMMAQIRQARTGKTRQAPAVDTSQYLPA